MKDNDPQKQNRALIISLGTRRLSGVITENLGASTRVLRFAELRNAEGFKRGEVAELDKAAASLGEIFTRLELGEEAATIPTYVLLSGPHLKMTRFSSSVYYSGYPRVITSNEVRQVIEQTRSVVPLALEDWILQVIPESFWVNDLTGVFDPLGLEAQRLAVQLQIYTTRYASFRNVARLFETLECNLQGYFPKTLTLPEGVLNASEKEGEVLLMDFSDESTHLVLTREGKVLETKSLDLGSRFLTSRIADQWQLSLRDAERLKERFGSLEENPPLGEELIPLIEKDGLQNHQIKRAEFHQSFYRFGEALFAEVEKAVKELLQEARVRCPSLVLTGGGAKLEGLLDFLSRRFSWPVRLGTPRRVEAPAELLMDPSWCGLAGLLHWIEKGSKEKNRAFAKENVFERTLFQLKEWAAAYF